jgi:hypothetical protein
LGHLFFLILILRMKIPVTDIQSLFRTARGERIGIRDLRYLRIFKQAREEAEKLGCTDVGTARRVMASIGVTGTRAFYTPMSSNDMG